MNKKFIVTAITATALTATGLSVAIADGHKKKGPFHNEIEARQALMQMYKFNIGILGAMAKGKMDYNAEKATRAAGNLKMAAAIDQSDMWPKGSDLTNKEVTTKTTAKMEAWTTMPKVVDAHKVFADASAKLADAAGSGLDGLRGAIGGVGKSCKGCHDDFRQKP